jgi:hypothetical protein
MKHRLSLPLLAVGLTIAAFFVVATLSHVALAADTGLALEVITTAPDIATLSGTEINVKDPAASLIGLVLVLIGALLKWAADKVFGNKGKVPLTAEMQAVLDHAIDAAVALGREKLQSSVKDMNNPIVKNKTVATALNLVLTATPGVIQALGVTEQSLEETLREKLGFNAQDEQ